MESIIHRFKFVTEASLGAFFLC